MTTAFWYLSPHSSLPTSPYYILKFLSIKLSLLSPRPSPTLPQEDNFLQMIDSHSLMSPPPLESSNLTLNPQFSGVKERSCSRAGLPPVPGGTMSYSGPSWVPPGTPGACVTSWYHSNPSISSHVNRSAVARYPGSSGNAARARARLVR